MSVYMCSFFLSFLWISTLFPKIVYTLLSSYVTFIALRLFYEQNVRIKQMCFALPIPELRTFVPIIYKGLK